MKHLAFDMMARAKELSDAVEIEDLLNRLPGLIGMTKMIEPVVREVSDGETSGVSGFVMINTSHISIHTWPEKNIGCIDVFSCKDYDIDVVVKQIEKSLRPYYVKITEVERMEL